MTPWDLRSRSPAARTISWKGDGVTEDVRPAEGADTAIVVEITPSSYRQRAIAFLSLGVLGVIVTVLLVVVIDSTLQPMLPLAAIAYGLYCASRARHQVTQSVIRIDSAGLRSGDGVHDHSWAGVVMVWVGSSTGLRLPDLGQPVLSVFTQAGVDFAARAGLRPQPRYTFPLGGLRDVAEICDRLSRFTDASIVNGTQTSRRTAAASLQRTGRP